MAYVSHDNTAPSLVGGLLTRQTQQHDWKKNKKKKKKKKKKKAAAKMSKFVEILDEGDGAPLAARKLSESDVKLEDVLADHEATVNRSRSSTQSSSKSQDHSTTWNTRVGPDSVSSSPSSPTSPPPKIKRLRKFTLTGGFALR